MDTVEKGEEKQPNLADGWDTGEIAFPQEGVSLTPEQLGLPDNIRILGKLGQGGMGVVYKAEHRVTKALLAIKVVLPQYAGIEKVLLRFIREARAATSLQSPHIVSVFDCGSSSTGLPYMIMDYVDGVTLGEMLDAKSLDKEDALAVFIQTAEALAYAHGKGIVHRDLKPANIMIVRNEGSILVKVLDFGIAKVAAGDLGSARELTQSGEVLGTPSYMSPEQALGQALDGRSDIYSLGCVMYHAVSGNPPFTGHDLLAIMADHATKPVPELTKIRPDVDRKLALVIEKALEKKPEDRYQTMSELVQELRKLKDGVTIQIRLTSKQRQLIRQAKTLASVAIYGFLIAFAVYEMVNFIGGKMTPSP